MQNVLNPKHFSSVLQELPEILLQCEAKTKRMDCLVRKNSPFVEALMLKTRLSQMHSLGRKTKYFSFRASDTVVRLLPGSA